MERGAEYILGELL